MIELPIYMDIPKMRRDTTKEANLRWLARNLAIRNSNHPQFKETMKQIKGAI